MKVKLNRGPMKNKRVMTDDESCYKYIVSMPIQETWSMAVYNRDPTQMPIPYSYKRGEYQRSHTKLKDGTIIFEWMGWCE